MQFRPEQVYTFVAFVSSILGMWSILSAKITKQENRNTVLEKDIENLKEFKESIGLNTNNREDLLNIGSDILHKRGLDIVFITLAEDGIYLSYKQNKNIIKKYIPGIKRDVVDVSGAGDTVISVISMLINDFDIEEIAKISNLAGGIVCEEIGVVPVNKNKLLKEYKLSKK